MRQIKLSPENRFVIHALSYFLRPEESSLPFYDHSLKRLDWSKIIVLAKYQNVLPIIYHVLLKRGLLNTLPPGAAIEMEKDCFGKTALAMHYESILKEISDALYQENIAFIVMKGPAIAFALYDPRELRPYQDLDVLIKKEDYHRVKAILSEYQFSVADPDTEERRRTYFNSIEFLRTGSKNISIDLHWDTLMSSWGESYFSEQKVWENIKWLEISDMKIPSFGPMILIPYLCIHLAFHHQFEKLQTLCDLDLAIQKFSKEIDWDEIFELSAALKMSKAVIYSLKLAAAVVGTVFPPMVLTILKKETVEERLFPFSYFMFQTKPISEIVGRVARFLLIDGFKGKVQALMAFLKLFMVSIIDKMK